MRKYPAVLYPTIVEGVIWGPVRCESLDGQEMYLPQTQDPTILKNFGPFEKGGNIWAVTHQQRKSSKGWIRTDPTGYHEWLTIRPQKQAPNGDWIPGTEIVAYLRRPFTWRWDVAGTFKDGQLRHFIWSLGYAGLRWD